MYTECTDATVCTRHVPKAGFVLPEMGGCSEGSFLLLHQMLWLASGREWLADGDVSLQGVTVWQYSTSSAYGKECGVVRLGLKSGETEECKRRWRQAEKQRPPYERGWTVACGDAGRKAAVDRSAKQ